MRPPSKLAARLALLTTVALAVACGGSSFDRRSLPPAPDPDAAPEQLATESLFVSGEYLAWSVKWKGLAGGITRWVIGQPGTLDGRAAIIAKSETKGDGLVAVFKHIRDELTTVIDLSSGAPLRSASVIEDGRKVEYLDATFAARGYDAVMRVKGDDEPHTWHQELPEHAHADDLSTAMAHLRRWTPPTGTRGYLYAQSGQSFYRIEIVAAGREPVRTNAGAFDTVRLEGTATLMSWRGGPPPAPKQRRFTMWFSEDERHLPVRIVGETAFGDVYAELTEFSRPRDGKPLRIKHRARCTRRARPGGTRRARARAAPSSWPGSSRPATSTARRTCTPARRTVRPTG